MVVEEHEVVVHSEQHLFFAKLFLGFCRQLRLASAEILAVLRSQEQKLVSLFFFLVELEFNPIFGLKFARDKLQEEPFNSGS